MKTMATLLSVLCAGTSAFAQGTVTFNNNPATLISVSFWVTNAWNIVPTPAGAPGSYYFGLLTSPTGVFQDSFQFAGVYGTNTAAAGLFTGGAAALAGIAPGTTFYFEVAGWSASLGTTFNPDWITNPSGNFPYGYFGLSQFGTATAGGPTTPGIIFGTTGLTSGFWLNNFPIIPEPTGTALAGLGVGALLIRHRRQ
jgi:hypothetical protein